MPEYHMSIDDGAVLASSASVQFKNIDAAMQAALAAATRIAAEELVEASELTFACEVQDVVTRETRRSTVRIKVEQE